MGSRWVWVWVFFLLSRRWDVRCLKVLELFKVRWLLKEVFWVRGGVGEGECVLYFKKLIEKCLV